MGQQGAEVLGVAGIDEANHGHALLTGSPQQIECCLDVWAAGLVRGEGGEGYNKAAVEEGHRRGILTAPLPHSLYDPACLTLEAPKVHFPLQLVAVLLALQHHFRLHQLEAGILHVTVRVATVGVLKPGYLDRAEAVRVILRRAYLAAVHGQGGYAADAFEGPGASLLV